MVLADTVGFIRELPHELVAAFQSTLQEAREAHLLLHVVDASDAQRDEHIGEVNRVLREIGAADIPQLRVYNKIDRLGLGPRAERDAHGQLQQVWISAAQEQGLSLLREAIAERLELAVQRRWLRLPPSAGALRAGLHAADVVREERSLEDGSLELLVELPAAELAHWAAQPGVRLLPDLAASPATAPPSAASSAPSDAAACASREGYLESAAPPQPRAAHH